MAERTKHLEIYGILNWAKVFESNRDLSGPNKAYIPHNGACTIDVLMDEENAKLLTESGSQKTLKEVPDHEGLVSANFVRKWEAPFSYGGAPAVRRADGSPWDLEVDGFIGNGSKGVVFLSVYKTSTGLVGTRLDAVQVIDHVEFEGNAQRVYKDYTADQIPKEEKPKASKSKASKKPKVTKQELEDEIPF